MTSLMRGGEGPWPAANLGFKADKLQDADQQLDVLVPQVVAALARFEEAFHKKIPVIAAGGIYTGEDILRFLQLGAQGVADGRPASWPPTSATPTPLQGSVRRLPPSEISTSSRARRIAGARHPQSLPG